MPRIGLDMVHFAPLLTDPVNGTATYGTPVHLPGAITASVEHTSDTSELDADDHTTDVVQSYGGTTVSINLRDLEAQSAVLLQGHTLSDTGGVIRKASDVAPYGALMFRSQRSEGGYQYVALFKGKFGLAGTSAETRKKGGVTFQTPTLSAAFIARDSDRQYEYYRDETDMSDTEIADWFDAVPEPTPV